MLDTASMSFIIEQVPLYAGVMMSLSRAVTQVGFSVGAGFGGILLLTYGYQVMFLIFGVSSIISVLVFHFFTVDPTYQ
jgi:predicted MFS family arabinose efflux permease